ncbi:hypothetical protein Clacol_002086 [Clathrus columnatus]|uniref:Beta-lactamase-related domain-containing protein n=1 Tax=Clathrus columnatus TaxID=1419009 RepID=A0AAV5A4E3_9AGAM|nr:hypothetical protein Clacol_002086 [Clathrus columnatus]
MLNLTSAQKETLSSTLQKLIDKAVVQDVAPGLQCAVFDEENVFFHGVSGLSSTSVEVPPHGKSLEKDTILTLASCSKLPLSIITLRVLERKQTTVGFGLEHLDDHDKLATVLPEISRKSGSLLTQIIDGFEDKLGPDKKKVLKLRPAKEKITLRMLLTHTSGMGYEWNHPLLSELCNPKDGSTPHKQMPFITGKLEDFELPLLFEPGKGYGTSPDWIGQFLVRATGKTFRQLFIENILQPLDIPLTEMDTWLSPTLESNFSQFHIRLGEKTYMQSPFKPYSTEHAPPPGHGCYASACMYGNLPAYLRVLRAVLKKDIRLLQKETWNRAIVDDLGPRGLKLPVPEWITPDPRFSLDVVSFFRTVIPNNVGVNLLQAKVTLSPTISGMSKGTIGWAGATNMYWFIDYERGFGGVIGTQLFPFMDGPILKTRDEFEKILYDIIGRR